MSTDLTTVDRSRLRALEKVVDEGVATFVKVGQALKEIRDTKLYRGTHKSFEAYIEDRWEMSRPRAYQLIESAEVGGNLSTSGRQKLASERQARELAKAPPEQQEEIWEEVTESTEKPTAKDVKKAVERRKATVDETDEVTTEPADEHMSDVEMALENASVGREVLNSIRASIKLVKSVSEAPGTELLVSRQRSIINELENARNAVSVTIPKAICPKCHGSRCVQCGNHGWVNSVLAKELGA